MSRSRSTTRVGALRRSAWRIPCHAFAIVVPCGEPDDCERMALLRSAPVPVRGLLPCFELAEMVAEPVLRVGESLLGCAGQPFEVPRQVRLLAELELRQHIARFGRAPGLAEGSLDAPPRRGVVPAGRPWQLALDEVVDVPELHGIGHVAGGAVNDAHHPVMPVEHRRACGCTMSRV